MQNRELSWLTFNERVLDQGADETVPLLERLNFISIFWSNLQEFFMVRVGSLTDLSLLKKQVLDSKTGMTPAEQLSAIHKRCHELYPVQEQTYAEVRQALAAHGVRHLPRRKQRIRAAYTSPPQSCSTHCRTGISPSILHFGNRIRCKRTPFSVSSVSVP